MRCKRHLKNSFLNAYVDQGDCGFLRKHTYCILDIALLISAQVLFKVMHLAEYVVIIDDAN